MKKSNDKKQLLTFNIDDVNYGVDISLVTEIIGLHDITPIPELPSEIKGIINLRGKIIPLMDVRIRLYGREKDYSERTCVIIIHKDEDEIGLIVDCVQEVISIQHEEEILNHEEEKAFIAQVIKIEEKVYMVVDIETLITIE